MDPPPMVAAYSVPATEAFPLLQSSVTTTHRSTAVDREVLADSCLLSMIFNVLWLVFGGGLIVTVLYFVLGLLFFLTIVGAPCGCQLWKLARLAFFPFGNSIESYTKGHSQRRQPSACSGCLPLLANAVFFPVSAVLLLFHLLAGLACACTIFGLPFAYAHLKLGSLALCPFGREIVDGAHATTTTTTTTTTITTALMEDGGGLGV